MDLAIVETKSTVVSAAFLPVDAFTGEPVTEEVTVKLDGVVTEPVYHPEGYVLFTNLADATYSVEVLSSIYRLFTPLSVDTASLDPKSSAEVLLLSPLPDYVFPEDATLMRALITDQNNLPLCGAKVEVTNNNYATFAFTDDAGRAVLFFDLSNSSKNLNVKITKEGYDDETTSQTILRNETINFSSQLTMSTPPAVAQLSGTVTGPGGYYVTQAAVSAPNYGVNGMTDAFGNVMLMPVVSQSVETVDLTINQEGFQEATPAVQGNKNAITNFSVVMNTNITSDTTRVRVRVRSGGQHLEDALVEIIEKGRAAYTISDGRIEQYFNDVPAGFWGEFVTMKASKPGYVTRTLFRRIRRGQNHNFTLSLPAC